MLSANFKVLGERISDLKFHPGNEESDHQKLYELLQLQNTLYRLCEDLKKAYSFALSTQIIHITLLISMQGFIFVMVRLEIFDDPLL